MAPIKKLQYINNYTVGVKSLLFYSFLTFLIIFSFFILISQKEPTFSKAQVNISTIKDREIIGSVNNTFAKTNTKARYLKRQAELEELLKGRIANVESLLARYNSPMKGYGNIIVKRAYECGGDYKLLMAIAGNESGFGRIPYKLYNPYGYLDGVQYSGWADALSILTCKISEQHLVPCNNNVSCVIKSYGGAGTNQKKWISNINFFMSQL